MFTAIAQNTIQKQGLKHKIWILVQLENRSKFNNFHVAKIKDWNSYTKKNKSILD